MCVCVCVCVCCSHSVRRCVSCCAGSPSNPGYFAGPARDTSYIAVLQGTNLTVGCVADASNPSVQYSCTHPSGIGVGRSEYFSLLYSGSSL